MHAVFVFLEHQWPKELADGVYLHRNESEAVSWQFDVLSDQGFVVICDDGWMLKGDGFVHKTQESLVDAFCDTLNLIEFFHRYEVHKTVADVTSQS